MFQKGFYNPLFYSDGSNIYPLKDGLELRLKSPDGATSGRLYAYNGGYMKITGTSFLLLNPSAEIIKQIAGNTKVVEKSYNSYNICITSWGTNYALSLITYENKNYGTGHALQSNPTLFIHSAADLSIDTTQWLGFSHDQTNPIISWGKGELTLKDGAANTLTLTNAGALADDIVSQAQLKTAIGEISFTGTAGEGNINITLPGGQYGFYPQVKTDTASSSASIKIGGWGNLIYIPTIYTTNIFFGDVPSGETLYAQQRYVTASGRDYWTMLLIDKSTGKIKAGYAAADHPCYGNGGDITKVPHPWITNNISGYEVIVLPLEETKRLIKEKGTKTILEHIHRNYKADISKEYTYKPMHSGIIKNKKPVMIETLPTGIKVRKLIKK